jgi:Ca2+-transporting ATPase
VRARAVRKASYSSPNPQSTWARPETGNVVPADCRLIESINLRVQESALTGESEPVSKSSKIEDLGWKIKDSNDIPLAERKTMVYMGSIVSYGRGVGIVTDTGMNTELGKIAEMMQSTEDEPTPLQRKLSQLGKGLALATIVLVFIIIGLGLLRGEDFKLLLLTSISIAVAAIPEGLPAIVTISLAMGARRMLEKQALIRKLPAVEALGSVTVICSDKTGTLTKNEMTVTVLDVANNMIELKQDMKSDRLKIKNVDLDQTEEHLNNRELLEHSPALTLLLAGGALCNDAILEKFDDENGFQIVGDPTEGALVVSAYKMGMEKKDLEKIMPRKDEIPFDSDRKRMTTVHELPDIESIPVQFQTIWDWEKRRKNSDADYVVFTKGAVDSLLEIADQVWIDDHEELMTEEWKIRIEESNKKLAMNGMRVLGVATKTLTSDL